MNGRITNLAKSLQLEDRIFSGDINILFSPIDWHETDRLIDDNRKRVDKLIESLRL